MLSRVLVTTLLLVSPDGLVGAQTRQPVVFSTPPQHVRVKTGPVGENQREIDALVSFTLTSALTDDTLKGTLKLSFVAKAKKTKQWVSLSPEALNGLPAALSRENVLAVFSKGTSCPRLKLEIAALELEGALGSIDAFPLFVDEKRDDEVSQLLCFWTAQVNSGGVRKGIIAKINKLVRGDEESQ